MVLGNSTSQRLALAGWQETYHAVTMSISASIMATQRPTVYLDTNILSVLHYRGMNVATIHRQIVTRDWWDTERKLFRVLASAFTEGELRQGSYAGQESALKLVRRMHYLTFTSSVRVSARTLLDEKLIPAERPGDAVQLAFAIVHRVDYLLTWNYAHLANVDMQRRLSMLRRHHQWRIPRIVTPETIPRDSLGQSIWRKDHEEE
jgi:predicted nucleic acid-binding protein